MSRCAWPAPAKLNLMLRVLGRRPDGYHRLQTVFQFLGFGDELFFEPRRDARILRRYALPGVACEADLVVRAARCLQRATGTGGGVEVRLVKRLPMGGGLGGGSSDAATTLVALNALWGLGLGVAELARLGRTLGADVPVFVRGQAAWAEGVGEQLTPLELPEPWYAVVVPSCAVSTAEIFSDPRLTRDSRAITIPDFLAGAADNDCTAAVCRRHPEVERALRWLSGFAHARLTGTGACVFAAFQEAGRAREVAARAPAPWRAFVARGANRSPLRDRQAGRISGA